MSGPVSTWMGDVGKPSYYVASSWGQLSLSSLQDKLMAGCVHLCRVSGNTVWSDTAGDVSSSVAGSREEL